MHSVVKLLEQLPPLLVYLVAAALVAGETGLLVLGLLVPSEATLLLVGFLAYTGTLDLGTALVVMISSALLGDSVAFRSGRRHGPRLRASKWGQRIGTRRWAKADEMLDRLGGRAVLVARWIAYARTLVPRLAGNAGMPYRRFAPWNLAGVVSWVGGSVVVGYLAGESYETVSSYLGKATGAVLVLLVAVVVIVLVGRWLGRNPDPVRALLGRARALPPVRWLAGRYGVLFFLLAMHIGPGWTLLINLAAGLGLLFASGLVLAYLVDVVVHQSGLYVVDHAIADWFTQQRAEGTVDAAVTVLNIFRGSFLIIAVALVAVLVGWRSRPWQADLVSVVGTVGASLPLVLLALVADLTQPGQRTPTLVGATVTSFPNQNVIVTASLCTLAWLLARQSRWPFAVAAWTSAAVGVFMIAAARLYVGWSSASETVTSILLGALWTVVFMVAWATRDRAVRAQPPATPRPVG
ncbi:undecaprenyl-diphosphatase [Micromonospora pisi]|uniref:Undecaprenyl-diphosphatase n=1 Tax=Micromonospora pisi TaxID=589240 RepID=A0A495JDF9_9ACTN|nr:VTT domain-containing protein [Micromonospora pisi]RKR87050.1 undecaprenyl-diphosphatase [Micromonospora pisi]